MYLPIVDEASCRLLIMLGYGLSCKVLGDDFFSQRIDPMLLQEIFQTDSAHWTDRKRRQDRFSTMDKQKEREDRTASAQWTDRKREKTRQIQHPGQTEREDKTDSAHWTDRQRRQDRFSTLDRQKEKTRQIQHTGQTDREDKTDSAPWTDRKRRQDRFSTLDRQKEKTRDSYLSELLHLYSPSRSLRSSSDTRTLKIQRFNRKSHGFRTFSHFGPHIWNNLPQDIRHSATFSSFKSQLKTFLFSEYFS